MNAEITKINGGGTSWYYLILDNKIIDSSHEDDREGMSRLYATQEKINKN
jgi:hypothetical protein